MTQANEAKESTTRAASWMLGVQALAVSLISGLAMFADTTTAIAVPNRPKSL